MTAETNRLPSSFRDPSGFVFNENGTIFRSINHCYRQHYDNLIQSGLYDKLVEDKLMISHLEMEPSLNVRFLGNNEDVYKIIQPEFVSFISYPYEWCFSQLKDAALTIIKIQKQALRYGMVLKDASAYNVQFHKGRAILIDTLSFEIYKENQPWIAYRQFCQHFLAPLALMAFCDIRFGQLMRIYIDGVPLELTSGLLAITSWLKPGILTHIHLHAKAQKRYGGYKPNPSECGIISPNPGISENKITKQSLFALIHHLEATIESMKWHPAGTEWVDYYNNTNYSSEAMKNKMCLVEEYISECNPQTVWDLGANTGIFSRIASAKKANTISFDIDPAAVEINYQRMRTDREINILPLCLDLTNPSPAIGWANEERLSLRERGPVDTILALALIHHLAISNNVPLSQLAEFFSRLCRFLIIEFVPKTDSQVKRLLFSREDIFYNYNQDNFEETLGDRFSILKCEKIRNTQRTMYLMENRKVI